ncbi:MAG: ParB/RepB/Spo0J family partition protein [Alphaproteobacteria bacterium]|nr:ParB/RepB/Spo0J family partition protein [Alphaproteobacteria bacterium]
MVSKFLGKGLAEINEEMGNIPDISVLTGAERVVVKPIQTSQIHPNPDQPRHTFTTKELEDLSNSIKEKGVLVPIIVRPVKNKSYLYEIVAGERRWRAAQQAGLTEIPTIVKTMDDKNMMEIALIENVQRENLNPIEEAAGYANLINNYQYSIQDVSKMIGKSESYIRNFLRINELPSNIKEMVINGKISASHARTIAVAENPEQIAKNIIENRISVSETQKMVQNAKRSTSKRDFNKKTLDIEYISKLEKKLKNYFNLPVKIKERRGGAGDFIISFANRIQMDNFIKNIINKKQ